LLDIIFQDKDLLAINKPAGLLVHRSNVAIDIHENVVDQLTNQLGIPVFPIHRLDRPTSGVLLFALNTETAKTMAEKMQQNEIKKWYATIVRGLTKPSGHITKAISSEYNPTKKKSAISYYKTVCHALANIPYRGYPTTPYSLVLASPQTGRTHQLRQHFAHIRHYIIGDKKHGDVKQNKHIVPHLNLHTMYLHACQVLFTHPITNQEILINAPLPLAWENMAKLLQLDLQQLTTDASLSNHPVTFDISLTEKQECTHYVYGG
jgi:tRNA pseudouridine65 synthase